MRLRLRTKFTLVMTSLVLLVVAVLSCLFAAQLLEQLIRETDKRANDFAHQVFQQAQQALVEAKQLGLRPGSDAPEEIRDYVRHAFEISEGLQTQLKDAARENPLIYEVSITDTDGLVLASSDDTLLGRDRKSTRLNSSHEWISYAVFCLKKKKKTYHSGGTLSSEVKVSIC